MKFESKFGIGEIVCTKQVFSSRGVFQDVLLKVIAVNFSSDGLPAYTVRLQDGQLTVFQESELIGDPDFNQETGKYPEDLESPSTKTKGGSESLEAGCSSDLLDCGCKPAEDLF
jgi:hypothetical protein